MQLHFFGLQPLRRRGAAAKAGDIIVSQRRVRQGHPAGNPRRRRPVARLHRPTRPQLPPVQSVRRQSFVVRGRRLSVGHIAEPFGDRIGRKMQIQGLRWAAVAAVQKRRRGGVARRIRVTVLGKPNQRIDRQTRKLASLYQSSQSIADIGQGASRGGRQGSWKSSASKTAVAASRTPAACRARLFFTPNGDQPPKTSRGSKLISISFH